MDREALRRAAEAAEGDVVCVPKPVFVELLDCLTAAEQEVGIINAEGLREVAHHASMRATMAESDRKTAVARAERAESEAAAGRMWMQGNKDLVQRLTAERDAARAEVERLTEELSQALTWKVKWRAAQDEVERLTALRITERNVAIEEGDQYERKIERVEAQAAAYREAIIDALEGPGAWGERMVRLRAALAGSQEAPEEPKP